MAAFFYHFFFMSLSALASVFVFAFIVYRLGLFSDEETEKVSSSQRKFKFVDADTADAVLEEEKSSRKTAAEESFEFARPVMPVFSRTGKRPSRSSEETDSVSSEENAETGFHVVTAAAAVAASDVSVPSRRIAYRRARAAMGSVVVKGLELDYLSVANAMTALQAASRHDPVSFARLKPLVLSSKARSSQRSAVDIGGVILFAGDEENLTYGFDGESSNATTKSIGNVNSLGVA